MTNRCRQTTSNKLLCQEAISNQLDRQQISAFWIIIGDTASKRALLVYPLSPAARWVGYVGIEIISEEIL